MLGWALNLGFAASGAQAVQTNKDGAGQRKRKRIAPKKFRDPKLEQLIKDLVALRNRYTVFDADETPYEEQLEIIVSEQEKAEKLKAEILTRIELIKARTAVEIAYRDYVLSLIRDIQEKRNQLLEDELISILLLAA